MLVDNIQYNNELLSCKIMLSSNKIIEIPLLPVIETIVAIATHAWMNNESTIWFENSIFITVKHYREYEGAIRKAINVVLAARECT